MMTTPEPNRTHEKPYTAPALLDFGAVCARVGRERGRPARLAFWRGAKSGTFSAPVKTSPGGSRIFWIADEIERWIADRPRAIYAKARQEPSASPVVADDLANRDILAAAWVESNWPRETAPLTRADLEGLLSALQPPEDLAGPILTHLLTSWNTTEPKPEALAITQAPTSCAMCGGGLRSKGNLFVCADTDGLGCTWMVRVRVRASVKGAGDAA